jgi:ketosteroid isomerase-like protein
VGVTEPHQAGSPDRTEVERANAAYYAAFEAGDLDAMRALWLDDETTVCVHPGADPVRGTGPVGRSWALVMAHTPYIQFILTDIDVALRGDVASVTCTENVLTADATTGTDAFGGARAVATNVFVRVPEGWRLWIHHASPVLSPADDEPPDEFPGP